MNSTAHPKSLGKCVQLRAVHQIPRLRLRGTARIQLYGSRSSELATFNQVICASPTEDTFDQLFLLSFVCLIDSSCHDNIENMPCSLQVMCRQPVVSNFSEPSVCLVARSTSGGARQDVCSCETSAGKANKVIVLVESVALVMCSCCLAQCDHLLSLL